jgi:hypothetical protein
MFLFNQSKMRSSFFHFGCSFTAFILPSAPAIKLPILLFYDGQRLLHAHDCRPIALDKLLVL